jgi:hypothetical protein
MVLPFLFHTYLIIHNLAGYTARVLGSKGLEMYEKEVFMEKGGLESLKSPKSTAKRARICKYLQKY